MIDGHQQPHRFQEPPEPKEASHVPAVPARTASAQGVSPSSDSELSTGLKEKESSPAGESEKSHALSAKYVAYLGCIKDNWSSCHAAKLLDEELISYLKPRFIVLSTPLKVRVLTSFLYIKSDLVSRRS